MAIAFILINTEVGKEATVQMKLKKMPEIISVEMVYGIYDLVAKIEADDFKDLKEGVFGKLRHVPNIKSTMTMTVIEKP